MSFFSWLFSAEGVFRACEIIAIVAGVLTVAALIGKDRANRIIQDRKATEMLVLQKEVADARTKQAEAEEKLESLRRRQSAQESLRSVSPEFEKTLKGKPTGPAVIVYVSGGSNDLMLAEALCRALNNAGWEVPPPTQISSVLELMPKTRATGDIIVACPGRNIPGYINALVHAFSKETYRFKISVMASSGHEFADGRPRIIINPR